MTTTSEEVLVFSRELLMELGHFDGVSRDTDRYLEMLLKPENVTLMLRAEAETSRSFKQLIPYVILRFRGNVFLYRRGARSGEVRLIDRQSIGLGGHITAEDLRPGWSRETYMAAARREVSEEVLITSTYSDHIAGLVNLENDDVGRVHFGVVHIWTLSQPHVVAIEPQILQGRFASIDAVARQTVSLESWSAMALTLL